MKNVSTRFAQALANDHLAMLMTLTNSATTRANVKATAKLVCENGEYFIRVEWPRDKSPDDVGTCHYQFPIDSLTQPA